MRNQVLNAEFRCLHCQQIVPVDPFRSGVQNRNHCPYCLWSRHLDLARAGDRLSACKGRMRPVGLALKRVSKRYAGLSSGELMLIHQCEECGKLSINRIAADDFADRLLEIYLSSEQMEAPTRQRLQVADILALQITDQHVVRARLFGVN
jgi:DNA-directed RNA polymerase subunit RPC12/RpoP